VLRLYLMEQQLLLLLLPLLLLQLHQLLLLLLLPLLQLLLLQQQQLVRELCSRRIRGRAERRELRHCRVPRLKVWQRQGGRA
jgi:hypothetical protein|tara:strand:- start:52 stop:297 length:246 start_codon:yes stop_codon:yes gene_type:complete